MVMKKKKREILICRSKINGRIRHGGQIKQQNLAMIQSSQKNGMPIEINGIIRQGGQISRI